MTVNNDNSPPTVASETPAYSIDMETCPVNAKVILLTAAGIAVLGSVSSTAGYVAWAPLPKLTAAQRETLSLRFAPSGA